MNNKVIADSLKQAFIIPKKMLLSAIGTISITTATMAQIVPSYVPNNGLVGWYPFNGNANDESLIGTNGTVNGASLTTDRFGNFNTAYNFNGSNSNIDLGINPAINNILNNFTLSYWIYKTNSSSGAVFASYSNQNTSYWRLMSRVTDKVETGYLVGGGSGTWQNSTTQNNSILLNAWVNVIIVRNGSTLSTFINSILSNSATTSSLTINNPTSPRATTKIGVNWPSTQTLEYFNGKIDDIAIYNRALSQQEITALYTGCNLNASITPIKANEKVGDNALLTASAADGAATFQWQSNPDNFGWQNIPSNATYSGATTKNLTVNNVQLGNHNQPFRVIAAAGTCKDTSDVATIQLADTCLITVHDTLVINRTITGLSAPNNKNIIKVYPNPAKDHVVIHYGNFAMMSGYSVKITNTLGQELFASPINQQTSNVNLSNWNSHSLYFIHIIDQQGKTVETRKILIE